MFGFNGDLVMVLGVILFFILFVFLMFVFSVFIFSLFFKRSYPEFSPKISIIIPAYNEEFTIEKTLDSIFKSDYESFEVILVDDGSTDRTSEIASKFDVKIIKGNHEGKTAALNLGLKNCSNEIMFVLDADTRIKSDCLRKIVQPLQVDDVAATSGSCCVANNSSLAAIFQNLEYNYNNLIRHSFSTVFNTGIWFFGAMSAYKKSVLESIGGFKADTQAEDMDIALELHQHGYRTVNVHDALGHTIVPTTFKNLYIQRKRWWVGVLQSLNKNRSLFSLKSSLSILFLFVNQYWWSFYAFISFPIIVYQVWYWWPSGALSEFYYLFRWFTAVGPFYVLYKLPEWGFSLYNFFGVMSGVVSTFLMLFSIKLFQDKFSWKNFFAIFFYFPYTIFLNMVICFSLLTKKGRYFIK